MIGGKALIIHSFFLFKLQYPLHQDEWVLDTGDVSKYLVTTLLLDTTELLQLSLVEVLFPVAKLCDLLY